MLFDIYKERMDELNITKEQLSLLSGVSVEMIEHYLTDRIEFLTPESQTALEHVLFKKNPASQITAVKEDSAAYNVRQQGEYTIEDYYAISEVYRVELIDGRIIRMEGPSSEHQYFLFKVATLFQKYIEKNHGNCIVLPAPLNVQLDCDDKTMIQPDISIICDKSKIRKKVIFGAPDLVVEITSPSTRRHDYYTKTSKYLSADVKEYWIVDLQKQKVIVYYTDKYDNDTDIAIYSFDQPIPVQLYDGELTIDLLSMAAFTAELAE